MLSPRSLLQKNVSAVAEVFLAVGPFPRRVVCSRPGTSPGGSQHIPNFHKLGSWAAIRGPAEGPDGRARLRVTRVRDAEPTVWKEAVLPKRFLDCCCPIKTRYQQRKVLRLNLKANEEVTLQILALTLFSYPSLAREFGKCQRSPWILQARERFCISPGLTVSADSSHMI